MKAIFSSHKWMYPGMWQRKAKTLCWTEQYCKIFMLILKDQIDGD